MQKMNILKNITSDIARKELNLHLKFKNDVRLKLNDVRSEFYVKGLFNCNNIKIKLINKLILRKKEIYADQNNLYK